MSERSEYDDHLSGDSPKKRQTFRKELGHCASFERNQLRVVFREVVIILHIRTRWPRIAIVPFPDFVAARKG
jgi:hypothetical protein